MHELKKKTGKVLTSKSVGTGPSSYGKRIYRAAVSQRLRNNGLHCLGLCKYTYAQWRNRLTTHFSEHIPVVQRHMSVRIYISNWRRLCAAVCLSPLWNGRPQQSSAGGTVKVNSFNAPLVHWNVLYTQQMHQISYYLFRHSMGAIFWGVEVVYTSCLLGIYSFNIACAVHSVNTNS